MPINVSKLQQLAQENSPKDKALTPASALAAALAPLQDTLNAQRDEWNKSATAAFGASVRAAGARMRAEAEARQVTTDIHALTLRHAKELAQLRKESTAAAQKYFWLGVAATILTSILFTFIAWLLSALNAGQFLSHLPHP